jgi:hypothetical protein
MFVSESQISNNYQYRDCFTKRRKKSSPLIAVIEDVFVNLYYIGSIFMIILSQRILRQRLWAKESCWF